MNHFHINNSKKASKGSQGLPSDKGNLEPGADEVTAVSQGADGRRSAFRWFRRFWKGINSQESMTVEVPPPQGADGKTTFKPKDLIITEEQNRYWKISEGCGPAELLEVCWLDVTGSVIPKEGKTYEISFKLSMNEEKSFGWEDPVSVMAKIGEKGKYKCVQVDLSQLGKGEKVFPSEKFRIEINKNTVNKETKLYFGLYEVWTNKWKSGLRIHEAIVQEVTTEDSASPSSEKSTVLEVTDKNSTSTSSKPTTNP